MKQKIKIKTASCGTYATSPKAFKNNKNELKTKIEKRGGLSIINTLRLIIVSWRDGGC
tara:strand:- start:34 stop:207 length:174 start_codon:yes stop_codon:yes gene_type:complete